MLDQALGLQIVDADIDSSRRDTTRVKSSYLAGNQFTLGTEFGRRAWVHRALRLRVAETSRDRHTAADIIRNRHYIGAWPVPPRTLMLSVLASLEGCGAGTGAAAAALATVALLPAAYPVMRALSVHPCEVLTLVRLWRADDLGPDVAPDMTPEILRRLVKGCRRSQLPALADIWRATKLRPGGLRAVPRLLMTYADPSVGHDGATYLAAGASALGPGPSGKLAFCWALDPDLKLPLRSWAMARSEITAEQAEQPPTTH